ncbi:MAG TPA: hypothetical protein DEB39_02610 [Planctomycetaceae bacterium]|nr:hypothetical protein [Planctomycetaceae bacterium]
MTPGIVDSDNSTLFLPKDDPIVDRQNRGEKRRAAQERMHRGTRTDTVPGRKGVRAKSRTFKTACRTKTPR